MRTQLTTERLLLRPFTLDDVSQLTYLSDPEWRRFLGPDFPSAVQFIAHNTEADWEKELNFAIVGEGKVLGSVHLGLGGSSGVGELACLLSPQCWGRGIAVEACAAVLDDAFGERGLFKAYARVDARHVRSIRVLEKLGLRPEAALRQHRLDSEGNRGDELWYSVLRSEWRTR